MPWCLGGDFNAICFPSERSGSPRFSQQMKLFNNFIEENGLVDLPLKGARFTWSNKQDRKISSCIDRFLSSANWMEPHSVLLQETLPNVGYDHVLIIFRANPISYGPRPFRFELMWLKVPGFKDKLKMWWEEMFFEGTINFILGRN